MGTISEKLTYLNDTRLKIKDSLNKFGADLTENDTFRSYSNVLNDIYDKLPKVNGNGSNFTLENVQNGKLDLFEMKGNTEQDSYSGKNLNVYPYNGYTVPSGMTFSANTDGTVLINGQNNNNGNSAFYFFRNAEFIIPAGTTYYIIPPSNTSIMYTMYDGSYYYEFTSNNNYSITFNEQTTITLFYVQIKKGNTTVFTNEKVYPMLSTTPVTIDDYEPYVGRTASPSPDYPQDIRVVTGENTINVSGKNLLPYPYPESTKTMNGVTFTVNNDGSILVNGTATAQANIKLLGLNVENQQKEFPAKYLYGGTNNVRLRALNNTNEHYIVLATDTGSGTEIDTSAYPKGYIELTVLNGTTVNNEIIKPMMLDNLNDTTYEPYQDSNYTLNLGNIELCKIGDYQDYIYKDNGKWYKHSEIGKTIISGGFNSGGVTNIFYSSAITDYATSNNIPYSNYYTGNTNVSGASGMSPLGNNTIAFIDISGATTPRFYIKDTRYTASNDLNAWLSTHNLIVYYVLATPTNTEITDTTLITQLEAIETETGTNIFEVSNDNDVLPELVVSRLKELDKLS